MTGKLPISIITANEQMRLIINRINKIADSDTSILLIGETGVGKEIFAEYIHQISNRSQNPFVKIGLSAMPTELLASELFGHEKGSFTSAIHDKMGLFELANTGSFFFDDIDDVSLDIQAKLLRVLETREIMKLGGTRSIPIDIRLITASKVDLRKMVSEKRFRDDLYYRINVVPIEIPPLRERRDDIPLLAEHFLKRFAPQKQLHISLDAMRKLISYDWPGNVRELRNVIHRISVFADKNIDSHDLPAEINQNDRAETLIKSCHNCFNNGELDFNEVVNCVESHMICETLKVTKGNQSDAARSLKMSLSTFRDKMKKYHLTSNSCSAAK